MYNLPMLRLVLAGVSLFGYLYKSFTGFATLSIERHGNVSVRRLGRCEVPVQDKQIAFLQVLDTRLALLVIPARIAWLAV
jgi:hypothetical protein